MPWRYFDHVLLNSALDLSQSAIVADDSSVFAVRSRATPIKIVLALVFAVPCLALLAAAIERQGLFVLVAAVFVPPLALVAALFGLARQEKIFMPALGHAVKSYRLLHVRRAVEVKLPRTGEIITYQRWHSGKGPCWFYHADVKDLEGFGFCVARDEARRDEFAKSLAGFLGYGVQSTGERLL